MTDKKHIAYCWATGLIEFGETLPKGTIEILSHDNLDYLKNHISVRARHGYGEQLLVSGIPEAKTKTEAENALVRFKEWVSKSFNKDEVPEDV